MSNDPLDTHRVAAFGDPAEDSSRPLDPVFEDLCELEVLRFAYTCIEKDFRDLGIDARALEAANSEDIEPFLQQLSNDLRARVYRPKRPPQGAPKNALAAGSRVALRDQVVQVALAHLLDRAFAPQQPCGRSAEEALQWLAGKIERGLTRIYAIAVEERFDRVPSALLLARIRQRIDDPELIDLVRRFLEAPSGQPESLLATLLPNVAFHGIHEMLEQAKAICHRQNCFHFAYARLANHLLIAFDPDPEFAWALPAVQTRLQAELAGAKLELDPSQTQLVDLAHGERFRFGGVELRCSASRDGRLRVRYGRLAKSARREVKADMPASFRRWSGLPLGSLGRPFGWIGTLARGFLGLLSWAHTCGSLPKISLPKPNVALLAPPHAYAAVPCGCLLIVAAFFQGDSLLGGDGSSSSGSRALLLVALELLLGYWLLSGIQARPCRVLAIGCFVLFGGYSGYRAITGSCDCGCFGQRVLNPWLALAFDVLAAAALVKWAPASNRPLFLTNPIQFLILAGIFISLGCLVPRPRPSSVPVDGVVAIDGAPLARAVVTFNNLEDNLILAARTNIRGQFVDAALPPGRYSVSVSKEVAAAAQKRPESSRDKGTRESVPGDYLSPDKTPLRLTVPLCGAHGVRFDLTSAGEAAPAREGP